MKAMKKEKLFTRNFTLLILGQVSSLTGNYTLKFALSMYVLEQTGSASIFAGMLSAALLPTVLLSPFGGILADRANRKHIMVALDALSGLSVLAAGLLLPLGRELWVIGALLVLLSVLAAFESPTVQACVPQMVSPQNLVQGNAVVSQVSAVTSLVTPFLGSLFYTAFGIGPVFAAAVACFWLTALLECMIHLEYQKPPRTAGIGAIVREDLAVSAHFLRREQPDILKLLLLTALAGMFVSGTAVVGFPYLVRTVLGLSATYYGAAESAMGAAAILGSLCAGLLGKKLRVRDLSAIFLSDGALRGAAVLFLCLPAGRLHLFDLRHHPHPAAHPRATDGQGDVLRLHPLDVRAAGGADGLRSAVRLLFRQRLLGAHPHRCAHLPDSGGVAGFFEKDGGGRVKQKGHLQKQMSFF